MKAITVVEDEVRELVRRRGLDPVADPAAVRRLVLEVIADYDERSVAGTLPQLVDTVHVARAVFDSVAGFGPLQKYLDDPTVEEIWINEPTKVFVARRGLHELTTTILSAEEVRDLVERMLKSSGRRVDLSTPFVDAMLPDGSRLHVVIPDITRVHWSVNIRKFVVRAVALDDLVQLGTLTAQAARFLEAAVSSGLNILVSGGTQSGKTTMLNCLTAAIPTGERVVTAEEVFELKVPLPDVVSMQCRQPSLEGTGEIKLRRLVKEALRMRPSRMIVGEVRQEESLDLLMVPLVYLLLTVFHVQGAAFAVSSAAREAGRVYATSEVLDEAGPRALAAARIAMSDSNLPLSEEELAIVCSGGPCLSPGSRVEVVISYDVSLPLLPRLFDGRAPATVRVTSRHLEVVDRFRPAAR